MGRETRCPYIFMSMGHVQSPTGETKKDKTQSVPYKRPRWCSLQASIETRDQDKPFLLQVSPSPFLLIIEAHVLALSLEDKLLEGKTHHHFNLDGRDQEEMDSQWIQMNEWSPGMDKLIRQVKSLSVILWRGGRGRTLRNSIHYSSCIPLSAAIKWMTSSTTTTPDTQSPQGCIHKITLWGKATPWWTNSSLLHTVGTPHLWIPHLQIPPAGRLKIFGKKIQKFPKSKT